MSRPRWEPVATGLTREGSKTSITPPRWGGQRRRMDHEESASANAEDGRGVRRGGRGGGSGRGGGGGRHAEIGARQQVRWGGRGGRGVHERDVVRHDPS